MATVKCDKCGKEVIIDETRSFGFCSFCGAKISCNQTTLNNPFDNSIYSNDIEREFLISNVTNIKNLHYISNNFQDNIDCLEKRKNDYAYKKEPEFPQKPVCEIKSKLDIIGDMIVAMIEIPIIGFFLILITDLIENKQIKKQYEENLRKYNENIEQYYKDVQFIKTENEKRSKALTNLEKAKNDLQTENKEALKLLEECYDINIIPSKYRNIYAITFIYDYLTTSQGTLRDALFACDLDKIQIQENICQGVFLRIVTLPCSVSFDTLPERKTSRQKDSLPPYRCGVFSPSESARLPQGSTTAALMGGGE